MAGRAPKLRRVARSPGSLRFAIVAARFNERITQRLVAGALQALRAARLGPDAIEVHWVPGSFELPQAASHLAATGRYAGIVCVGVVIRGQTPHFEHVAREAASGIRQVALATGVPATFGLITALSEEQAWARAGGEVGNRGEEAAEAALQMAEWIRSIRDGGVEGERASRSPARVTPSEAGERASRGHVRLSQATRGPRRPHGTR
ncbi:MAG: 6,7-dimethyl-8-ribityllumazine synthase [Candidatus Rokuibacteriota bacterium]|nr:MAG: 6,7-dimethyl-8-ribityllumazine synthase [Candidatus Rokubacteria bacterium]